MVEVPETLEEEEEEDDNFFKFDSTDKFFNSVKIEALDLTKMSFS